jgi:hypothetical protein
MLHNMVDVIITDSIVTITRKIDEASAIYRLLQEHKVKIIFLKDFTLNQSAFHE